VPISTVEDSTALLCQSPSQCNLRASFLIDTGSVDKGEENIEY